MKNYTITVNGNVYDVTVEEGTGSAAAPAAKAAPKAAPVAGAKQVTAPMPGTIVSVKVNVGDKVEAGTLVAVLEAMKMENEIMAPHDATVAAVHVNKGDSVDSGTALVSLQ